MPFFKKKHLVSSMRAKLTLSWLLIGAVLLISAVISVFEYKHMSSYVSDLIADDISSINVAQTLSDITAEYNLEVLAVIGDEDRSEIPNYDDSYFISHVDKLRSSVPTNAIQPLADSVLYNYSAYMLTSLELPDVLVSDFIDSRAWYFDRLQPRYRALSRSISLMLDEIQTDLRKNSEDFDHGFFRSIIPSIVSLGVGLLLILMLLFYVLAYYVNPLYKMLDSLNAYLDVDKRYNYEFDGDDQLAELNRCITEITAENQLQRRRIARLKNPATDEPEGDQP